MKVVILAGGLGTRFSEETELRPKPMIEIGGKPILWHIMKHYSQHGFNDFVVCLGYKGYVIKEYFANYFLHQSNVTFDLEKNSLEVHQNFSEPWKVTLVDTGYNTQTGARIKKIQPFVDGRFMVTYGDGVSNVDFSSLLSFHEEHGGLGTLTSVQPEGRFGALDINLENHNIKKFREKPKGDGSWINGGFFIFENKFFDYLEGPDDLILEREPFEKLSADGQFFAYKHDGFWKCMDTQRDRQQLESLWNSSNPPWKSWT